MTDPLKQAADLLNHFAENVVRNEDGTYDIGMPREVATDRTWPDARVMDLPEWARPRPAILVDLPHGSDLAEATRQVKACLLRGEHADEIDRLHRQGDDLRAENRDLRERLARILRLHEAPCRECEPDQPPMTGRSSSPCQTLRIARGEWEVAEQSEAPPRSALPNNVPVTAPRDDVTTEPGPWEVA